MKEKEIVDEYVWSDRKKILTHDRHKIPGLGNISHFALGPNETLPLHYHSDIAEIHCIVKGQRTLSINQDGVMTNYTAASNELTITKPFELHSTTGVRQNRSEFFALQINMRKGAKILGLSKEYSNILREELMSIQHHHLKLGNSQISLLRTGFNLLCYGKEPDKYAGVSYLTSFLFSLKYLEQVQDTEEKTVNEAMQNVLLYVDKNITYPLNLQELADISGYSLSHFKYKFKEDFGVTPAEYISLQKISLAERELLSTNISITDLAFKLSFSSSNYFCTVFKKVLGYSPSDYRKLFRINPSNTAPDDE